MPGNRERGFTLIEVLVAFVIAAGSLALLYEGTFSGLLATRVAGRTEAAVSLARSRLATIGHGTNLVAGERSGEDGAYRWRMRIAPMESAPVAGGDAASIAAGPHAALYAVTVWMSWQEGGVRTVRLDSEAVGPAP